MLRLLQPHSKGPGRINKKVNSVSGQNLWAVLLAFSLVGSSCFESEMERGMDLYKFMVSG